MQTVITSDDRIGCSLCVVTTAPSQVRVRERGDRHETHHRRPGRLDHDPYDDHDHDHDPYDDDHTTTSTTTAMTVTPPPAAAADMANPNRTDGAR